MASCPGGTASNVVTFLANADVALSVMMTTVSTFAAVVMTPLLTKTLVGAMVPVDAKALFVSTLQASLAVSLYVHKTLTLQEIPLYSAAFCLPTVVQVALLLCLFSLTLVVVSHGDFCASLIYGAYQTQSDSCAKRPLCDDTTLPAFWSHPALAQFDLFTLIVLVGLACNHYVTDLIWLILDRSQSAGLIEIWSSHVSVLFLLFLDNVDLH